jgi:starch-binding outer membrane protein, SusD/RagB family
MTLAMKKYKFIYLLLFVCLIATQSCLKDLDSDPIDPSITTSATVFDKPSAYIEALAKCYAGLALTGQYGPDQTTYQDIKGMDEGLSQYIRQFSICQDLSTEQAIWSWSGDAGGTIYEIHYQNWTSSNQVVKGMYNRIFYQIAICNEYIRQVSSRVEGLSADLKPNVYNYLAEARFLRALSYYHALDLFRNVPFVTEKDPIGIFYPTQVSPDSLFNYIESELSSITDDNNPIHLMNSPTTESERQAYYAGANKGCAWSLLAKLYLNSETYLGTGKTKANECVTACNKVIASGYSLMPTYKNLFLADNNLNNPEIIFPVAFDGNNTQCWGGTTYLILGAVVGDMSSVDVGLKNASGWNGLRVTKTFVNQFESTDLRGNFYTTGQKIDIDDISKATDGYGFPKFTNLTSTGDTGKSSTFPDTDFPMIRLADVYLMYAEATLRGATNGVLSDALSYVNLIRKRANVGELQSTDLTLDFILDERSRELSWECTRRTDLIRYGKFTGGTYLWPWKGAAKEGVETAAKYNIYPIPSSDKAANPKIIQNPGY